MNGTRTMLLSGLCLMVGVAAGAAEPFTGVWVNGGGVKTFQEERPLRDGQKVTNAAWDGKTIRIAGARNEVVEFKLMLEGADDAAIKDVSVSFKELAGPKKCLLQSKPVAGDGVFDYVDREIELFYIKYVKWTGLSGLGFSDTGGEGVYPKQFRKNPQTGKRDWNKHIPDIAVPLELHPAFDIAPGQHQAIWCDIYIPRDAPSGEYKGKVVVKTGDAVNQTLPVVLTVRKMELPDEFNVKTMLFYEGNTTKQRFTGSSYWPPAKDAEYIEICNNIRKLAQRHRITLAENHGFRNHRFTRGNVYEEDKKSPSLDPNDPGGKAKWEAELDKFYKPYFTGEMFTRERGYEGPGMTHGGDVFAIYQYFATPTRGLEPGKVNGPDGSGELYPYSKRFLVDWAPNWCAWFASNAPDVEFFYYIKDEDIRTVAWDNDLGKALDALPAVPGQKKMRIFKTAPVMKYMMKDFKKNPKNVYRPEYGAFEESTAKRPDGSVRVRLNLAGNFPDIDIWSFPLGSQMEPEDRWKKAYKSAFSAPDNEAMPYNGGRPSSPCFMTEGGGTDPRALVWVDEKFGFGRHFYFMGNLWWNFFGGAKFRFLNFWEDAHTHGMRSGKFRPGVGYRGWNFANGDGVLFYPGTDHFYPKHNYRLKGAIASLRLKYWRRGIQDAEYIRMARKKNSEAVKEIIRKIVPRALWEIPSASQNEPFWYKTPVSTGWSENPDDYAKAVDELTKIITSK